MIGSPNWSEDGIMGFNEEEYEDLEKAIMPEGIELENDVQLDIWQRAFADPRNIIQYGLSQRLPGIPYTQRQITDEIIRREFVNQSTPSWSDTHPGEE